MYLAKNQIATHENDQFLLRNILKWVKLLQGINEKNCRALKLSEDEENEQPAC